MKKLLIFFSVIFLSASVSYAQNTPIKNKDGLMKKYYEDGTLMAEAFYKNGKLEGWSKNYDRDGHLLREYLYEDGIEVFSRFYNLKEGKLLNEQSARKYNYPDWMYQRVAVQFKTIYEGTRVSKTGLLQLQKRDDWFLFEGSGDGKQYKHSLNINDLRQTSDEEYNIVLQDNSDFAKPIRYSGSIKRRSDSGFMIHAKARVLVDDKMRTRYATLILENLSSEM